MSRLSILITVVCCTGTLGCFDSLVGAECALPLEPCNGTCIDAEADRFNCGGCDITCRGACEQGQCARVPVTGDIDQEPAAAADAHADAGIGSSSDSDSGVVSCEFGAEICAGECVDLQADSNNCGTCTRVCVSGLCNEGSCVGTAGHVILIGHDYIDANLAMQRILGNAVFMANGASVHVLAYQGSASKAVVDGVKLAIHRVADEVGRQWSRTVVEGPELSQLLPDVDILLIYPQTDAGDSELWAKGRSYCTQLVQFLDRGGLIISLEAPAAHHGTFQLLAGAGVLDVSARSEVTASTVTVSAPLDALTANVPMMYAAETHTVSFTTEEPYATVSDGPYPVVMHKPWF